MRILFFFFGLIQAAAFAQLPTKPILLKSKNQWVDSNLDKDGWKYFQDQYTNESTLTEGDEEVPFIPSLLQSGKDLFSALTGFSFSIRRFRMKGLSNRYFSQSIHEISMNQLSDGNIPWANWGGLNEVTSNNQYATGLKDNEFQFGALGNAVFMQLNASKLFPQTTVTLNLSNRNYHQRIAFTKVWSESKNGWSFASSIAYKQGVGGQLKANEFKGFSYFLSIDKRLRNHLFSLVLLGNSQMNTRTAAITEELAGLAATKQYQPGWGLQANKIRNANWQFNHQPMILFSHEYNLHEKIKQISTLLLSSGEKYTTALDWYNAADPRPDYYRYLPSFFTDSLLAQDVLSQIQLNPSQLQINWDHLYWINQNSSSDKRARYLLEDRVERNKKIALNTRYRIQLNNRLLISFQGQYRKEVYTYFKRINDLLGAKYSINWNQFAEDNLPNSTAIQNDLNHPNQIIRVGDSFGYHYAMHLSQWLIMSQAVYTMPKFDLNAAIEYTSTYYQREGKYRNGVFPQNSFGLSEPNYFNNGQIKMGITYKLNGRNYYYFRTAFSSKPPLVNDLYISPRINSLKQLDISNEWAFMVEAGYILNAPKLKITANAYWIRINNAMDVMSFYHDGYRNLVNYNISNIGTQMMGLEWSMAYTLFGGVTFNAAMSVGKYVYHNRPNYSVMADNEPYISEKGVLYIDQFPITGLPHLAIYNGLAYRSNSNLFLNLSSSYMGNQWLSFNPIRRTYDAAQNLPIHLDAEQIAKPSSLPNAFILDFSAGYSCRIKKFKDGSAYYLQFFLGVNNLLNQSIITGGYEQLRFDIPGGDINKFPNKYYYSPGTLYSLSIKTKL
ncbi:hypothetical protein [Sediminibacterium sp.]|uniref:hypothetical protein n=1 Tax=Sediminibacterium sp. TaxID=1917865 RepID=UPI0025DF0083|nr:hypothetical protein [Sediminibacterium sp.]MBT9484513.1 TonB-dependent receptor [Sediminibacterium sp.]